MRNIEKYIYTLVVALGIVSCSTDHKLEEIQMTQPIIVNVNAENIEVKTDKFSSEATFSPEFGWGYQILNNGELFINQPHIPSIQGNKGFETKDKAIFTADYIIHKLDNNIFPPTISPQELDSLGVM